MNKRKWIFSITLLCLALAFYFLYINVSFLNDADIVVDKPVINWGERRALLQEKIDQSSNDFQKTSLIRKFAASHVDYSWIPEEGIWELPVKEIYDYFEQDRGGGYCGLASMYLMKLYHEFGYQACTYDMGELGTATTHQTVVVKVNYPGGNRNIVQDPTFNFTVTTGNNIPLDLKEIIELLQNKEEGKCHIREAEYHPAAEFLTNFKISSPRNFVFEKGRARYSASNGDTYRYSIKINRSLARYEETEGASYYELFKRKGLSKNMLNLFLLPINKCECMGALHLEEEIETLKGTLGEK